MKMETKEIFKWIGIAVLVYLVFNLLTAAMAFGQAMLFIGLFKSLIATM